ncbi:MAG: hypothetical protein Q6L19_02820 [Gloeomargarita sp. GMQP_bins_69]
MSELLGQRRSLVFWGMLTGCLGCWWERKLGVVLVELTVAACGLSFSIHVRIRGKCGNQ